MEEIGIPELTAEQIKKLCEVAEEAARKYVLSRISSAKISTLNITIDAQGPKPINVNVDIEIALSPLMKKYDVKKLTIEAAKEALASIETCLKGLKCKSGK